MQLKKSRFIIIKKKYDRLIIKCIQFVCVFFFRRKHGWLRMNLGLFRKKSQNMKVLSMYSRCPLFCAMHLCKTHFVHISTCHYSKTSTGSGITRKRDNQIQNVNMDHLLSMRINSTIHVCPFGVHRLLHMDKQNPKTECGDKNTMGDKDVLCPALEVVTQESASPKFTSIVPGKGPPPEPPVECCMSGCANCVWIQYAEELKGYYSDGQGSQMAKEAIEQIDNPGLKMFLKLELGLLWLLTIVNYLLFFFVTVIVDLLGKLYNKNWLKRSVLFA